MSSTLGDQAAVVAEAPSQPHQAAVAGEPPKDMASVPSEPVLLGNGLSSDQPVSALSHDDESSINGIREEKEKPSDLRDASMPLSTSSVEGSVTAEEPRDEEEFTHRSTRETSIAPGSSPETPPRDAGPASEDIASDVEVTQISDGPSQRSPPESEVVTYNSFSALEHVPSESYVNPSDDVEVSLASNICHGDGDRPVSVAGEKEIAASSGKSASELVSPFSAGNAESIEDSTAKACNEPAVECKGSPTEAVVLDKSSDDVELEALATGKSEPVQLEPDFDVRDLREEGAAEAVPDGDVKAREGKFMDANSTRAGAPSNHAEHADSGDASVVEDSSEANVDGKDNESSPGDAFCREAGMPKAAVSDKVFATDGDDHEVLPRSSLTHFDKDVGVDSIPLESSGQRSISVEESNCARTSEDEILSGEDWSKESENGHPSNSEKPLRNDEKANPHFKVPVILTVAVAVVGVVAVSISKWRQ